MCKRLGAQLTKGLSTNIVCYVATESGLQTMPDGTAVPENAMNAAECFYSHLLESCERLFDNVIDQATFEDTVHSHVTLPTPLNPRSSPAEEMTNRF